MIPTYLLVVFVGYTSLSHVNNRTKKNQQKRWESVVQTITLFFCIGCAIIFPIFLPVFQLASPSGSYDVGRKTIHLIDKDREEVLTAKLGDHRELMVTVSYPTEANESDQRASYIENTQQFVKSIEEETGVPSFLLDYLKHVDTNSYEDTILAAAEKPYPVLLLSHGFPGTRFMFTGIVEELASSGFIIVSIDHTYYSNLTLFPSGEATFLTEKAPRFTNFKEWDEVINRTWTKDQQFVLDFVEDLNKKEDFKGKIDLNAIGVLGHSFGGAAAFQTMLSDERVKAAVNMDGTYFGKDSIETEEKKPFLLMATGKEFQTKIKASELPSEKELESFGLSKEDFTDQAKDIYERRKKFVDYGGQLVLIDRAKHMSFSDYYLYTPFLAISDRVNAKRDTSIVTAYITDFFEKHLKGKKSSLLNGQKSPYDNVRVKELSSLK